MWLRDDQIALKALRRGEPEKAASLFTDEQWESVANYRSGEYETSLKGFRKNKTSDGFYNQGNALARIGQYEDSIASYQQALISKPNDPDTLFNKALVEKLLEEKQQSNDQDGQNQQDEQSDSSNDSQNSSADEQQEQNEEENQSRRKTNHRKNRDKKIKALNKAPSLNKKKMTNQQETRKNKLSLSGCEEFPMIQAV